MFGLLHILLCRIYTHFLPESLQKNAKDKKKLRFYDADSIHIKHCRYQIKFKHITIKVKNDL